MIYIYIYIDRKGKTEKNVFDSLFANPFRLQLRHVMRWNFLKSKWCLPSFMTKIKRGIIEACSIAHLNTIPQQQGFFQNFTIYRKNNIKRIQNSHKRLVPLSLNIQSNEMSKIRFSNHKTPFTFQKKFYYMT